MPEPLTIWCKAKLPPPALEKLQSGLGGLGPHRLLIAPVAGASNLAPGGPDPLLEQAEVAWGQADPRQVVHLPRIRWVQITTAGYTRYDTREFREAMRRNGAIV